MLDTENQTLKPNTKNFPLKAILIQLTSLFPSVTVIIEL